MKRMQKISLREYLEVNRKVEILVDFPQLLVETVYADGKIYFVKNNEQYQPQQILLFNDTYITAEAFFGVARDIRKDILQGRENKWFHVS